MSMKSDIANEDLGGALMAWYEESIREYPDGLVSQAQAAIILGISRMAVSRLVARGYLRAVYFPKPPDVSGVVVGDDDPTWVKVIGWLGIKMGLAETYAWPKACYVSFADVKKLWQGSDAKKKCRRDWNEIMATFLPEKESQQRIREVQGEYQEKANREREDV
jgi:predicted DNA-binding transcriptional regulator AlpA